jgi:hypothetical protein
MTKDLEFIDTKRTAYQTFPIQRAKDIKPVTFSPQKKLYSKHLFSHCPGMIQYAELGYIVPAWIDIHILANKAGVASYIGSEERGDRGYDNGREMDSKFLTGLLEPKDGIPAVALNFACPWGLFSSGEVSALIMPAIYHSTFLEDIYVVPGVVDYSSFHTMNFICVPQRKCEVHIKAGDPLLHVIPFWNKPITAGYGPGDDSQIDAYKNQIPGEDKQYYRKYQLIKKEYELEELGDKI